MGAAYEYFRYWISKYWMSRDRPEAPEYTETYTKTCDFSIDGTGFDLVLGQPGNLPLQIQAYINI